MARCWWGEKPAIYRAYHDDEWGRPVTSDQRLFEKLCLEGFQAGLSWLTILKKREAFRRAFSDFDPGLVTRFTESDVERLLLDATIVRHRKKIEAAIHNAGRALALIEEAGSIYDFVRQFRPGADRSGEISRQTLPATTAESTALSKALKQRDWRFVGPTTVYAFMQAMGLVNDHVVGCHVRAACRPHDAEGPDRG